MQPQVPRYRLAVVLVGLLVALGDEVGPLRVGQLAVYAPAYQVVMEVHGVGERLPEDLEPLPGHPLDEHVHALGGRGELDLLEDVPRRAHYAHYSNF